MREIKFFNSKISFCVIEDDSGFRDTFASLLEQHGDVIQIDNYHQAIRYLRTNCPDMLFVDIELHGRKDGFKIIELASKKDIHCVVVSGHEDENTINECITLGAKDYYFKGNEVALINDIISKYKRTYKVPSKSEFIQTNNNLFKQNLEFILSNSKTEYPILLYGPTGCGKTYYAKMIHMKSEVKGKFVALNCSTIPKDIFESEMFGHDKGAFSGADKAYPGKIIEADGGTLYLDEIDSMPLSQQAKLLKVIEDKEFYPVGSNKIKKSNFRLVCSSQRNLREVIHEKKFREDLYYRISFIETRLMPLNERKNDILPTLKDFLKGPRRYQFTPEFISTVEGHDWPGNLRELQIFASNIELSKESRLTHQLAKNILNKGSDTSQFLTNYQKKIFDENGLNKFLAIVRSEVIKHCLEKNDQQINRTIRELGISSASFYRWKDPDAIDGVTIK